VDDCDLSRRLAIATYGLPTGASHPRIASSRREGWRLVGIERQEAAMVPPASGNLLVWMDAHGRRGHERCGASSPGAIHTGVP
jgi:hypothetical protein